MGQRMYLQGNYAVAHAVKLAAPNVVAAYPITPQSSIVEKVSEFVANGELNAEFVKVESEYAALSVCCGAACTGSRVFTATSSQGLAYMSEMLPFVSGSRFPVVMAVVNRGMAAPWTIWGDHQDSVSQRDTGWIQIYVENAQEALDTCLQAYRIAEDQEVQLPIMVCQDGFTVSHTDEIVDVPLKEELDGYLTSISPNYSIDFENPSTFCIIASPDIYFEYKYYHQLAMDAARVKIAEAAREFQVRFGRSYGGLIDTYFCEDADYILITMGSVTETARTVVARMRSQGVKVGLLKVRSFRPFPFQEITEATRSAKIVGVLDRNLSYGCEGALGTEVKAALHGFNVQKVLNFIAGLGGRDIRVEDLETMFEKMSDALTNPDQVETVTFVGLRCSK